MVVEYIDVNRKDYLRMEHKKGVFLAYKQDKTPYYRTSLTYKGKHISLESKDTLSEASLCYEEAVGLLNSDKSIEDYYKESPLSFSKWVILINFRDNDIYFKTPIYLLKNYFFYYISCDRVLKFDADDLFYYSTHTITVRNGHMFVADYGMQVNILSRYGIRNHAVAGRDYIFVNGDSNDFTYNNIKVINKYYGVEKITDNGKTKYKARIHVNGDFIIGYYDTEEMAAIAYNKAAEILNKNGLKKNFPENYIENLSAIEFAKIYNKVTISKKIRNYVPE